ncbi:hypothetical protein GCM10010398_63290 [Streptomyces fimbriatus]
MRLRLARHSRTRPLTPAAAQPAPPGPQPLASQVVADRTARGSDSDDRAVPRRLHPQTRHAEDGYDTVSFRPGPSLPPWWRAGPFLRGRTAGSCRYLLIVSE